MESTWIKLYRSLLDWEWINSPRELRVFLELLLRANHKQSKWRGRTIEPGQLLTGRKQLATWTGLSERQIRTAINNLISTNELTIESTNAFSLITLTNWSIYQFHRPTKRPANSPTIDQQLTTSNNVKNNKEDNIPPISPKGESFDWDKLLTFINHHTGRSFQGINEGARRKFNARLKQGLTKERIMNAIINASASEFHRENGCRNLTPEFFSRESTIDRWGDAPKQRLKQITPDVCRVILQAQPLLQGYIDRGYTVEQIKAWAQ